MIDDKAVNLFVATLRQQHFNLDVDWIGALKCVRKNK